MRVECIENGDADMGRDRKALFLGQFYELPEDIADGLIRAGKVRPVTKAVEPVEDKAIHGPEVTKARRTRRGDS